MRRTTIAAPAELIDQLRRAAERRGIPLAALIREALEEKAQGEHPKPRSLGLGDSVRSDIAERTTSEPAVLEP